MVLNMILWFVRALASQSDSRRLAYFQVNLTPGRRLIRANIAGSNRRADGLLASLSAYPVRAQQDALSQCKLVSTSHLSSRWPFLNRASVCRHIGASKQVQGLLHCGPLL